MKKFPLQKLIETRFCLCKPSDFYIHDFNYSDWTTFQILFSKTFQFQKSLDLNKEESKKDRMKLKNASKKLPNMRETNNTNNNTK